MASCITAEGGGLAGAVAPAKKNLTPPVVWKPNVQLAAQPIAQTSNELQADAAAARRAAAMAIGSPSPPAGEIASLDDAGPEHRAEVEGNLQQQQAPCTPKVIPNLTFPQYIPPILFYFLD